MANLQQHLNPNSPTPAVPLLDIINAFSAVSRKACWSLLENPELFRALLPLLTCCAPPTTTAGTKNQTAPVPPSSKPMALHKDAPSSALSYQSRATHPAHQSQRPTRNSRHGSLAHTRSFVDNTNALLPHHDLSWFLTTFAELARRTTGHVSEPEQNPRNLHIPTDSHMSNVQQQHVP